MEASDGMFPFYLPLSVRVRSDDLTPTYLHSTRRLTRDLLIYALGVSPMKVCKKRILTHTYFSFPLILFLVAELAQASECLWLMVARAFDLYFSPSLSGLGHSVFPLIKFFMYLTKWVLVLAPTHCICCFMNVFRWNSLLFYLTSLVHKIVMDVGCLTILV